MLSLSILCIKGITKRFTFGMLGDIVDSAIFKFKFKPWPNDHNMSYTKIWQESVFLWHNFLQPNQATIRSFWGVKSFSQYPQYAHP